MTTFAATSSLNTARAHAAVVRVGNWLSVLGGLTTPATAATALLTTETAPINDETGALSGPFVANTSIPLVRYAAASAVHVPSGRVWLLGGIDGAGASTNTAYHSLFNTTTGVFPAFAAGTAMPANRSAHHAEIIGNTLYVWAGYVGTGTSLATTVWRCTLDAVTGLQTTGWTVGTALAVARRGHIGCAVGTSLFSFGGQITLDTATASPHTDQVLRGTGGGGDITWTSDDFLPTTLRFLTGTVCVQGTRIFLLHLSSLMSADASSGLGAWIERVITPPQIVGSSRATFYGDHMWIVGGVAVDAAGVFGASALTTVYYNSTPLVVSDAAVPTVTNVSPADASELTRHQKIAFRASSSSPDSIGAIMVWMKYRGQIERFLVFDGDEFVEPFVDESTRTDVDGDGRHYDFEVGPSGGWVDDIESFRIRVIDNAGNLDVEL